MTDARVQILRDNVALLPPAVRAALTAEDPSGPVEVECSPAQPRGVVLLPDGRRIPLHPSEDPVAAAAETLARHAPQGGLQLVVAIGLGLGYLLDAIEQLHPGARVLALEPVPAITRAMLARRSWRDWLTSGRLTLLVGPDYRGASDAWRLFKAGAASPPVIMSPLMRREFGEAAARATAVVRHILAGVRANEEARRKFAGRYLLNTLANLPVIAAEGDAGALFGAFSGLPAIVVAAGPSLDRNLDGLRRQADRALIVAVDTAVRPLLAAGIRPHLVVAVDPSDLNARHLRDLPETRGMWLVAEGSLDPSVFPAFRGRTLMFHVSRHQPWPWLADHSMDRGELQAWGSVLTTAFDVALRAGCDPVVFAGADLAYTGGLQYCRHTVYEPAWRQLPTDAERAKVFAAYLAQKPHQTERDVTGGDVLTTPHFVQFRDWLVARAAAASGRRIINATGGGILHGGPIVQGDLDALELPVLTDSRRTVHAHLHAAWTRSVPDVAALQPLKGALARGMAGVPLGAWLEFAGEGVAAHDVAARLESAADGVRRTVATLRHFTAIRDQYDRSIRTIEDGRRLSHPDYDTASRQAAAQAAQLLLEAAQRTRRIDLQVPAWDTLGRPGEPLRVLDFGCGIGRMMEALVDLGLRVDGADLSGRILEMARRNPKLKACEFFLTRGNDCGAAPDGVYDLVFSHLTFREIRSRSARNEILQAMARVLRPGGIVIVQMRFYPDLRAEMVQPPHAPWSADDLPAAYTPDAALWPTLDELPLIYADFARTFFDVRLQVVDLPPTASESRPAQLIVSGSTAPSLAGRMYEEKGG